MKISADSVKQNKIRKKLGKKAEKAALKYLKKNGYKLVKKNYEISAGEIDIIVEKKELISFVEVRSKTMPFIVSPIESITIAKQKKIVNTAINFIQKHHLTNKNFTFDVVSVVFDAKSNIHKLEHITNAFTPKNRIGFM